MGAKLTFDEATHTYRVDGRVVPSVTQILGRVYRDVYANIPGHVIDRKARLGTAVHKAIELELDGGRLNWETLHPEVRPYMESWARWWSEQSPGEFTSERQSYAPAGYGMTTDFSGVLGGELTLIDWKITGSRVKTHPIQIAAYDYGSGMKHQVCGCLYLRPDGERGEFVPYETKRLLPDWLATLRVYNLMEMMK